MAISNIHNRNSVLKVSSGQLPQVFRLLVDYYNNPEGLDLMNEDDLTFGFGPIDFNVRKKR